MKITKRNNPKYPLQVIMDDDSVLIIPKQGEFSNDWLRKHGCSLMAEYIALQWLGVKKYPIHLHRWHKKHTPKEVAAKVTIKGVAEGINSLSDGHAKYYKDTTAKRIASALSDHKLVIMEQKDPIHTVILLPDKGGVYMASHGKVKKVSVNNIAKTALKQTKYKGMVEVSK